MATALGTLESVALELANVLGQLSVQFSGPRVAGTLLQLGVVTPPGLLKDQRFINGVDGIVKAAGAIPPDVEKLITAAKDENVSGIVESSLDLTIRIVEAIRSIDMMVEAIKVAGPGAGMNQQQLAAVGAGLAVKLLDLLIIDQLMVAPAVVDVLPSTTPDTVIVVHEGPARPAAWRAEMEVLCDRLEPALAREIRFALGVTN